MKEGQIWSVLIEELLTIKGFSKLDISNCDLEDKAITQLTEKISNLKDKT